MKRIRAFILKHFEASLVIIIIIGILAIALLVRYKLSFLNFFFLPVILSGYFLGKNRAVLTASLCVLLVVLYLVFANVVFGRGEGISFDEIITLITWASFLILTAGIIGIISEQREAEIKNLRRAYVGVLDIMLKYLEFADEEKPHTLRVAHLAGKMAHALRLNTREVENIKSAAMLLEAGDLHSSLALFTEVGNFMKQGLTPVEAELSVKERVMLKTTASLLGEARPILDGYFRYYVEEAKVLDKKLSDIPIGSSIIALADHYDKISAGIAQTAAKEDIKSMLDIEKLAGRSFPVSVVQALLEMILASEKTGGV